VEANGQNVQHPVLFGEYELTVDDKNRLLVPAEIRRSIPDELGDSLFMSIGQNRVPWLWPGKYYEHLASKIPSGMTPGEDRLAFDQLFFAMANKLTWDKQGRILMPDKTLKRASIGKQVTLIGVRDHLELWNTAAWEAHRDELEQRASEIVRLGSPPPTVAEG
jgi:MraZ protein